MWEAREQDEWEQVSPQVPLGSGSRGESCSAEQRRHSITAVHKGHLARILLPRKQAVQASRLSQ